jgi:mycothiol synthase
MTATDLPAKVSLRRARFPDDIAALAAVISAADARFPTTPELLAAQHATADPALNRAEWVAEIGGEMVGAGGVSQQDAQEHQGEYWLRVRVAATWQRKGVGRALLEVLEQEVRRLGGRRLKGGVRQDVAGAVALAERSGYARAWTRYESSLTVTPERDFSGFGALLSGVQASGILFRSVAELAADPERNRQLWELNWQLLSDVPMGMAFSKTPLEVWVRQRLEDPTLKPELSFVALDPAHMDEQTGPYIGYSTLHAEPNGEYDIGMTGTLPEYRGRGVAKSLKVRAMQALQMRGGGTIRTFNDPPNVAMLGMNAALGFVRGPDIYRYERELA